MGLTILQRIDFILTRICYFSMNKCLPEWSDTLGALGREIRYLMGPDNKEIEKKLFIECHQLSANFKNKYKPIYVLGNVQGYVQTQDDEDNIYSILFFKLIEYEDFLKSYLQEKNMLMSKKADLKTSVATM